MHRIFIENEKTTKSQHLKLPEILSLSPLSLFPFPLLSLSFCWTGYSLVFKRGNRKRIVRDQMRKTHLGNTCIGPAFLSARSTRSRIWSLTNERIASELVVKIQYNRQQQFSSRSLCKFYDTTRSISLPCLPRPFLSRLYILFALLSYMMWEWLWWYYTYDAGMVIAKSWLVLRILQFMCVVCEI